MTNRLRSHQNYRCYYASYRGIRVLIPGCWGAAVGGKEACTCPPFDRDEKIRELERRLDELETKVSGVDWSRKR